MKFYYNGKLIRTSKNHVYTYAVLTPGGKTFACSSSLEGAKKAVQREISLCETIRNNYRNAIKAIEAGQSYYFAKESGQNWRKRLNGETVADFEKYISQVESNIAYYKAHQIVELEARN